MRTKLSDYLARTGISHRAFAAQADIPHLHPMVSQWAAAKRWPGRDAVVGIERATAGEIPASYWTDLRRAVQAEEAKKKSARRAGRKVAR